MKYLPYKSNSEIQLGGRELRAENFKKEPEKKVDFGDKYIDSLICLEIGSVFKTDI